MVEYTFWRQKKIQKRKLFQNYRRRLVSGHGYDRKSAMRQPIGMALFGMVWLLRVRSEMKRCAKCRRQELIQQQQQEHDSNVERTPASVSTFFTIDTPAPLPSTTETATLSPGHSLAPTTYCEVHGFNPPKEGNFKKLDEKNLILYIYKL